MRVSMILLNIMVYTNENHIPVPGYYPRNNPASAYLNNGLNGSKKMYQCGFCSYQSYRTNNLRRHVEKIHPGMSLPPPSHQPSLASTAPLPAFLNPILPPPSKIAYLNNGLNGSKKMYQCGFCNYQSYRTNNVRRHVEKIHPGMSLPPPSHQPESDPSSYQPALPPPGSLHALPPPPALPALSAPTPPHAMPPPSHQPPRSQLALTPPFYQPHNAYNPGGHPLENVHQTDDYIHKSQQSMDNNQYPMHKDDCETKGLEMCDAYTQTEKGDKQQNKFKTPPKKNQKRFITNFFK